MYLRLSQNIILSLLLAALLISCDVIFSAFKPSLHLHVFMKNIWLILILCTTFSFFKRTGSVIVFLGVVYLIVFLQMVHYSYFATWIFPSEIIVLFKNLGEVYASFSTYAPLLVLPFLLTTGAYTLSIVLVCLMKKRIRFRYTGIITTLILLSVPIHTLSLSDSRQGQRPDAETGCIVNSYISLSYFFCRTLPENLFPTSSQKQVPIKPLKISHKDPNINIIFIMGESLTFKHMSLYNYSRQTTPFLDSLKNANNMIIKKGVSGAATTETSLSMFFNMMYKPSSAGQMSNENHNLFQLAQNNGFYTGFVSAQSPNDLKYIKAYLDPKYINYYQDSSFFGDTFYKNSHDMVLASFFEKFKSKKPFFLVLHQRGSHASYIDRYPKSFAFYKFNGNFEHDQVNAYDNSVCYTDAFYKKIITLAEQKLKRPTYIIITSDHGESLGENGIFGHGNYLIQQQHKIPMIIIGLHGAKLSRLRNRFLHKIKPNWLSHFELSQIVATLLGYKVHPLNRELGYYVNGRDLLGHAGFMHIKDINQLGQMLSNLGP